MQNFYDKLLKILKLESEKAYADTAVIGGLDGFLSFWLSEAREQARATSDRRKVEEVAARLHGYAKLAPDERRDRVLYLIERLSGRAPDQRQGAAPTPFPGTVGAEASSPTVSRQAPSPNEPPPPRRAKRRPARARGTRGSSPAPTPTPEPPSTWRSGPPIRRQGPPPRPQTPRREWAPDEALQWDAALDEPVTTVRGIGAAKSEKLERMGIRTVRDLLLHAPFRYEDYTTMKPIAELVYGDEVTLAAVVQSSDVYKTKRGTIVVSALLGDGTGVIEAKWFGNRYLVNQLRPGTMLRLSGRIDAYLGRLQLKTPRFESLTEEEVRAGRLVPIYSRTAGISEKVLTRDIDVALEQTAGQIPDPLPVWLRDEFDLPDLGHAIRWLHQPKEMAQVQAARRRLAFDELLRLQVGMLQRRREWKRQPGHAIPADRATLDRFLGTLPFALTGAQQRALREILEDMAQASAMSRLLQGDVGSGKTVVAAAALLVAVTAGYQGALMAPTEILAEQHFASLRSFLQPDGTTLLEERDVRLALLTGSTPATEKQNIYEAMAAGELDVIVGTHALIQEGVEFARLGLAIVDEQHRFGVKQRGALREKTPDGAPDILVMSATPIPRSLALTLYGDLDLSLIDEMPPGRQPIVTRTIAPHQRERAYTYIRRQLQEGRQAFVVCPLVEESEKLEARAAVEEHRFLQEEVFPDFEVELLHGRMRPDEKERAMARFYRNESQILVSTSVVEVGIDVPNATVMLVEGANRFGLAQLHQFRGRIGRGPYRSLCLLMAEATLSSDGEQRLNALVENQDGFALAEEDLQMRGPGDFFGTRQSGLPALRLARLGDVVTLNQARQAAQRLLAGDPDLSQPEHRLLKAQIDRYWAQREGNPS